MIVPWAVAEVGGIAAATVMATGAVGFTSAEATALVTAITASVVAIIAAVITLIKALQTSRDVKAVSDDIQVVRVLVDGHMSRMVGRVEQLTAVIETSDKDVPAADPAPDLHGRVAQLTVALEGSDTEVPDPTA